MSPAAGELFLAWDWAGWLHREARKRKYMALVLSTLSSHWDEVMSPRGLVPLLWSREGEDWGWIPALCPQPMSQGTAMCCFLPCSALGAGGQADHSSLMRGHMCLCEFSTNYSIFLLPEVLHPNPQPQTSGPILPDFFYLYMFTEGAFYNHLG